MKDLALPAHPAECRLGLAAILIAWGLCSTAQAALRTWSGLGPDSKWTTATNWVGGVAPSVGDDLLFPTNALSLNSSNDFPAGTTFNSLIFSGGGYSLSGNAIALNAGILATNGINNAINNPLILNSNQTFAISLGGNASFNLYGAIDTKGKDLTFDMGASSLGQVLALISGAGGLVKTGAGSALLYESNTFSGPVQVLQGGLSIYDGHALGDTNGSTTVSNGAVLTFAGSSFTVPEPVILAGSLNAGAGAKVLTGPLTLVGSDAAIGVASGAPLTINAIISGPGGFTKSFPDVLTLNSNNTYTGATTVTAGVLVVNGAQPVGTVALNGGLLGGTGTVGAVTASGVSVKTVSPGPGPPYTPGSLSAGNVSLDAYTTFSAQINSAAPGSGYDQLNVTGSVSLDNAFLSLTLGYRPAAGDRFVILNNDGNDPVQGTFSGLPEGATLTNNGVVLSISYQGGDGNDIVLYAGTPPARLTGVTASPNGVAQIQGLGLSNLTYAIQAATNLNPVIQWSAIGAALANTNGLFSFTDTNAPQFPMRFYRAISP